MTETNTAIATKTVMMKVQEIAVSNVFLYAVYTVYNFFR